MQAVCVCVKSRPPNEVVVAVVVWLVTLSSLPCKH